MRLVKRQSKNTYVNDKTKKTCHFYNYYIECDNGKRIGVKPISSEDYKCLDMVADYER